MTDEHQTIYSDDSGRLGFADIMPKIDEFTFGKRKRYYRIDGKLYKSKKSFIKALEHFAFEPQPPKQC